MTYFCLDMARQRLALHRRQPAVQDRVRGLDRRAGAGRAVLAAAGAAEGDPRDGRQPADGAGRGRRHPLLRQPAGAGRVPGERRPQRRARASRFVFALALVVNGLRGCSDGRAATAHDVVRAIEARRRRRRRPAARCGAGCATWPTRWRPAASRAIEITMTVPRAVELIAELAARAAGRRPHRRRHGARRRRRRAAVIDAGARVRRQPGVPARASSTSAAPPTCAVMPGCFTPTEILAAWEAGADVVKVFPATSLGPGVLQGRAARPLPQVRLMPTGGVTRENAGDWIRAGAVGDRRRHGAGRSRGRRASGRFDAITADARVSSSTPSRRRAAAGAPRRWRDEDRLLRRDHAAAQPAGLRALLPVAGAAGHLRRRRSQRRGQPRAVRLRQPLRDARCRPTRWATRRCGRCAPRACTSSTCCAAASRLGIYFAETGASQRASTVIYDRAHSAISELAAGQRAAGTRAATAPRWFHWTGITPALGAVGGRRARARRSTRRGAPAPASASTSTTAASCGREARGAADDAAADAAASTSSSPTKRTCRRCSASRSPHADVTGGALDVDGYRDACAARGRASSASRAWP